MLRTSDYSVSDIAELLCFKSKNTLLNNIKKDENLTPNQFRKISKKGVTE